ncbi:hypothetical protein [Actinoplanes couchii]|uniref:SAF domain-containing protein n=1 Tax=Actinoplanes couchii TaxID=403638 RepID=A0ABQ3XD53_9ACTN|nr:hypothetical protein [Actinoplanes couchii]MDR6321216.1 hypothetical protein [Actinoplanes couchii]GID56325.1 hypothetical protein Aco03nite_047290 [Actinoplanes couchii]
MRFSLVVVLLVAVGGVAGWQWWQARPPYGPEELGARATLEFVDQETADAALAPGTAIYAHDSADQIVLGRVTWNRPAKAQNGSSLRIVLLDRRDGRLPGLITATSSRPDKISVGMDGVLNTARERDPWLGEPRQSNGSDIYVSSLDASPVTFQTVLRQKHPGPDLLYAPIALENLTVALIHVAPDGQVHWAQRLR